jgi:hypothetical protein
MELKRFEVEVNTQLENIYKNILGTRHFSKHLDIEQNRKCV